MRKISFLLKLPVMLLLLLQIYTVQAQQQPFWNEIQVFKKQDSLAPPPKNAVLFVGSSSFNFWKDVHSYFPGYTIINRGFGGSTLKDVIRYADKIIFPYKPKQIVVYCGENDLAEADTVSPHTVLARFKQLFQMCRNNLGEINFVFVSIKPSPSRAHLRPKMEETNSLIKSFLNTQRKTAFVDVYTKMLNQKGEPIADIFLEDKLHMNAKGYIIWQKAIKPFLLK